MLQIFKTDTTSRLYICTQNRQRLNDFASKLARRVVVYIGISAVACVAEKKRTTLFSFNGFILCCDRHS